MINQGVFEKGHNKYMKVMLVFPPQFDPSIPNLALPCLTAFLRAAGHEVIQKDINVESYDILLSAAEIERASEKIGPNYNTISFLQKDIGALDRLINQKDLLIKEIENAKRVMRDPKDYYDYRLFTHSQRQLEDGLKFIAAAYFRTHLSFNRYEMFYSPESTKEILSAVKDPSLNLYHDFYTRYSVPEIVSAAPQLVGISISSFTQVIPGLTLAYLLKQVLKNTHIVIGGIHFTVLRENLAYNRKLFSLFDSLILFEGETALTRLLDCLESGNSLSQVPNLIFRDGEQIVVNDRFYIENIDQLPTPSYDGLPLSLYFSPHPVLMTYASRGCYWGRCAFCNHSDYTGNKYRLRSPEKVVADILEFNRLHHCNTFGLADLAVSPNALNRIVAEIIESGIQVNWFCMTRFEKELDHQLCRNLAKAGCKMLLFGLESGSHRILSLMDKGTNPDLITRILAISSEAGITNCISCIIGFPTETINEAKETIRLIQQNLKHIASIHIQIYGMEQNCKIYHNPKHYKVFEQIPTETLDLSWDCDYKVEEGLSQKEAANIAYRLYKICAKSYADLFNIFHPYLLYMIHYHQINLLWLTSHPDEENLHTREWATELRRIDIEKKLTDLLNLQ